MRRVLCISWGAKYGAPHVNRLRATARRHLAEPVRSVCFTDAADGLAERVEAERAPLPPVGARAHLAARFTPRRRGSVARHLGAYVRPAPRVAEAWRE